MPVNPPETPAISPLSDLPEDNGLTTFDDIKAFGDDIKAFGEATEEDIEDFISSFVSENIQQAFYHHIGEPATPEQAAIAAEAVFDAFTSWKVKQQATAKLYNLKLWQDRVNGKARVDSYVVVDGPDGYGIRLSGQTTLHVDEDEIIRYAKWLNLARSVRYTQLEFDFVWMELKGTGQGPDWVNVMGDIFNE